MNVDDSVEQGAHHNVQINMAVEQQNHDGMRIIENIPDGIAKEGNSIEDNEGNVLSTPEEQAVQNATTDNKIHSLDMIGHEKEIIADLPSSSKDKNHCNEGKMIDNITNNMTEQEKKKEIASNDKVDGSMTPKNDDHPYRDGGKNTNIDNISSSSSTLGDDDNISSDYSTEKYFEQQEQPVNEVRTDDKNRRHEQKVKEDNDAPGEWAMLDSDSERPYEDDETDSYDEVFGAQSAHSGKIEFVGKSDFDTSYQNKVRREMMDSIASDEGWSTGSSNDSLLNSERDGHDFNSLSSSSSVSTSSSSSSSSYTSSSSSSSSDSDFDSDSDSDSDSDQASLRSDLHKSV